MNSKESSDCLLSCVAVHYCVLQCVLQCVAGCRAASCAASGCSVVLRGIIQVVRNKYGISNFVPSPIDTTSCSVLQCVAVCCSVLQCVAVQNRDSILQCVAVASEMSVECS